MAGSKRILFVVLLYMTMYLLALCSCSVSAVVLNLKIVIYITSNYHKIQQIHKQTCITSTKQRDKCWEVDCYN